MDTRVLRQFLSVARHGSIGRAAEAEGIGQSALSKSMQRLESKLGARLFERSSAGVTLTPYGEALVRDAAVVCVEVDRLRAGADDYREGRVGHVTIGSPHGLLDLIVLPAILALRLRHPNITFSAAAGHLSDFLPALSLGEIDLVIGTAPTDPLEAGIVFRKLFRDAVGIVAAVDHPLHKRAAHLADLADQAWVLPSPDHSFTRTCRESFLLAGLSPPRPSIVSSSYAFIEGIVSRTDCLSIMPLWMVNRQLRPPAIAHLDLPGGTWPREVHLFWKHGRDQLPAVGMFLSELEMQVDAKLRNSPAEIR